MYQLRDYQQEAVDKTIHYFQRKRLPAVIVLPTGAGKSLVIAEMAKVATGRVLCLAHVKELVEQNHEKYESYGLRAGIFSAGLNKKEADDKVIFGSIQSVARAEDDFFKDFTLLVIDECHRVSLEADSQYATVIRKLRKENPNLCILGLTATPYRLGLGWIYNHHSDGSLMTNETRFFRQCIYDLSLEYMIENDYLTKPIKVDIPVTCYDFSELVDNHKKYTLKELENLLKKQRRLTPLIIKNIVDITETYNRQGVMIFCSTVKHAKEILDYLPAGDARIVLGDTEANERDQIIQEFKRREFKYLVNVSVLTTGFDAPHVDVIAILRPTESVSLYQQIIGRGLRLDEMKEDCLILDYSGVDHNIYRPQVRDRRPRPESVQVEVECPKCGYMNLFWGIKNHDGEIREHYGRTCRGGLQDEMMDIEPCGYRFRFKICDKCFHQNDISARECESCEHELIDPDSKIKQAKLSKDSHVLQPETITVEEGVDKNFKPYLEIRYYDFNADFLQEIHYLESDEDLRKFDVNFLRSHQRIPELKLGIQSIEDAIREQKSFRMPAFVIGRKKAKEWQITEKIFYEELSH